VDVERVRRSRFFRTVNFPAADTDVTVHHPENPDHPVEIGQPIVLLRAGFLLNKRLER
jgi:hypothetical protein